MRDFAIAATVCLAATFPFAAPAHAFTAQNGLVVEPDANGFAVPWRGMAGPAVVTPRSQGSPSVAPSTWQEAQETNPEPEEFGAL